jgi:hypothetical protein
VVDGVVEFSAFVWVDAKREDEEGEGKGERKEGRERRREQRLDQPIRVPMFQNQIQEQEM